MSTYIEALPLAAYEAPDGRRDMAESVPIKDMKATVNASALLSFVDGLEGDDKSDVLYSIQFAQRAASAAHDKFDETPAWYRKYIDVLEILGWAGEQFAFTRTGESHTNVQMDKEALSIITAVATGNQLAVLTKSIEALGKLADDSGQIDLFDFQSSNVLGGNFQIGAAEKGENGLVSFAVGAFYFKATERKKKFLFVKWSTKQVNLFTAAQRMVFNQEIYAVHRDVVKNRLKGSTELIANIPLS